MGPRLGLDSIVWEAGGRATLVVLRAPGGLQGLAEATPSITDEDRGSTTTDEDKGSVDGDATDDDDDDDGETLSSRPLGERAATPFFKRMTSSWRYLKIRRKNQNEGS